MLARPGIAAAATALVLLTSTSAFAVDAQAFADRLKTVAEKQGATLQFSGAEAKGDDVILHGVTFKGAEDAQPHDLTFEHVTGSTPDGWNVDRLQIPDVDKTKDDTHVQVSGMIVQGLQIAGTQDNSPPAMTQFSDLFFDQAEIGSVDVSKNGKSVVTVKNAEISNDIGDDGGYSSDFSVDTFTADFTNGNDADTAATMKDIGYPQVSGSIQGSGAWDPSSGTLELDPFVISIKDAGDLSLSYEISGYTPSFIKSLQQLQEQMAANPDNKQGTGMAVMGLISQLYVDSADITFVDHSLTSKLLDHYAKKNGQTAEQLVQGLTGMLPAMLSYLQNPDFQKQVTDAVTTFLKDPKSLSISVAPENPVAVTQVVGAAMGAPQTLPSVLALTVNANDTSSVEVDQNGDSGSAN